MRALVQRVSRASVTVDGKLISEIPRGVLTLLGVAKGDTPEQLDKIIQKILDLRIFPDEAGKMNLSLRDIQGSHLIVSQFTLMGDTSRGNRPGFSNAEAPDVARGLYERALEVSSRSVTTLGGVFGADMKVELLNDGPVTLILET